MKKRSGKINVIYHKDGTKKAVLSVFSFTGIFSLLKSILVAYRTRCDEVTIFFKKNQEKDAN